MLTAEQNIASMIPITMAARSEFLTDSIQRSSISGLVQFSGSAPASKQPQDLPHWTTARPLGPDQAQAHIEEWILWLLVLDSGIRCPRLDLTDVLHNGSRQRFNKNSLRD